MQPAGPRAMGLTTTARACAGTAQHAPLYCQHAPRYCPMRGSGSAGACRPPWPKGVFPAVFPPALSSPTPACGSAAAGGRATTQKGVQPLPLCAGKGWTLASAPQVGFLGGCRQGFDDATERCGTPLPRAGYFRPAGAESRRCNSTDLWCVSKNSAAMTCGAAARMQQQECNSSSTGAPIRTRGLGPSSSSAIRSSSLLMSAGWGGSGTSHLRGRGGASGSGSWRVQWRCSGRECSKQGDRQAAGQAAAQRRRHNTRLMAGHGCRTRSVLSRSVLLRSVLSVLMTVANDSNSAASRVCCVAARCALSATKHPRRGSATVGSCCHQQRQQ